tara:strand:- start:2512 stop:3252 length:741 start_codon:yes stop_codon:yes gene_type:complete
MPPAGVLGKRGRSNSTSNRAAKVSAREVNLPKLQIGTGMGCPIAGMPRYMKRAQKTFDELGYVSAFFDYNVATNQYGITKSIDTIVKRRGNVYTLPNTFNVTNQVYFFMVGLRNNNQGHSVSVLVDARVPSNKRIWVFDPLGETSRDSIWGRTMRQTVVPIIKQLWGVSNTTARYYNGRNLQANNTRGVCSTFYVTFMDIIPFLLNGSANINQLSDTARINGTQMRAFFLNFAPNTEGRVIAKNNR